MRYNLFIISVLLLISCSSEKQQNSIPTVDVTKTYSKKEIVLQDIANVEYIPLETRDDVLIGNYPQLHIISSDSILVGNYQEGAIFLFNGKGKLLSKFNHKGASDKEYQEIWGILYDKKSREVMVMDYPYKYQMQVYDDRGNYKRTIPIDKKYSFSANEIVNYNDTTFLCYDKINHYKREQDKDSVKMVKPFILIGKKDGKELGRLPITLTERVDPAIVKKYEKGMSVRAPSLNSVTNNEKLIILSEVSKDTIFTYSDNKKLKPILVRTPQILSMSNPLAFLQVKEINSKYIFANIIEKRPKEKRCFLTKHILVDRTNNNVYEYEVKDVNISIKGQESLLTEHYSLMKVENLKELLKAGKLKGKLKTIAENLKEDDNPILIKVALK